VLGQSYSPGFEATTSDGTSLGEPTLVNGFANGWRIDPSELGEDLTVDISWTPQRLVWIGLALSALGVLACAALILLPVLRRRRTPAAAVDELATTRPEPASPWLQDGPVLAWPTAAAIVGLAGVGATVFGSPVLGLVTALTALVAARVPRGQVLPRILSLGMFAAAAGFILAKQLRNDYVVDFNWVGRFETAHGWALLAVFTLVLSVVVDGLRRRRVERD
jgi:arabinofuranan 3-O-arabinosyltransferase